MIVDDVLAILQIDATLLALLPGGMYGQTEITRQRTPEAFDANAELKPCLLVNLETETQYGPFNDSSASSSRAFLQIFFYQRVGYDAITPARERVFSLLHDQKIGAGTWSVSWVNEIPNLHEPALDCDMATSRYQVVRRKA
jgi:hypothetical protein